MLFWKFRFHLYKYSGLNTKRTNVAYNANVRSAHTLTHKHLNLIAYFAHALQDVFAESSNDRKRISTKCC